MSEKNIAKGVVWAYVTNHPLLFWNYKKCTSNWQRATDFFQRYLNIHSIELRQFQQKRLMFWGISKNIYVGGSYLYISATEFIKKKKSIYHDLQKYPSDRKLWFRQCFTSFRKCSEDIRDIFWDTNQSLLISPNYNHLVDCIFSCKPIFP